MAHDAQMQSLTEYDPSLERQVKDLQAILPHLAETAFRAEAKCAKYEEMLGQLLARIGEVKDQADANGAKIGVCLANSASATARVEQLRELGAVQAREAARDELLRLARAVGDEDGEPQHAKPKKKRKLPPGWGGVVAGTAVALAALKAHRAAAAVGTAALLTAAAAPMTASILPDTDAHLVPRVAHHHVHRAHDLPQSPVPAAIPPRRRHRHTMAGTAVKKPPKAPAATAAPSPPASPMPSPTTTGPVPSPAVTPTPVPSPTITPDPGATAGLGAHPPSGNPAPASTPGGPSP